ncbi:MAG: hypothetical protein HY609_00970 [Deltaproteobacteria bacterium]|nr:hypothetical protein [Deltaproteobacteria bacterium]MBI4223480.1 hypothetical protein [Deltaproteobacteria bacterium]
MIDPNKKQELPISPSEVCYQAFSLMKGKRLDEAERLLASSLAKTEDKTAAALYHSALGVLHKMKKDYKEAWRHYERAEKLIPDDPALKIIVARLLIEQFAQYDQAIRRAKRVLKILPANPVFVHQAFTTIGLAQIKRKKKQEAIEALEKSIVEDFEGFITAKNIDFHLVEALLRNDWGENICCQFVSKALAFAKNKKEKPFADAFEKMLKAFQNVDR